MTEPWNVLDFVGKYHRHNIRANYPIGGTAVAHDLAHETQRVVRAANRETALEAIASKHGRNMRQKTRQARCQWKIEMEERVGGTLRNVGQVLDEIELECGRVSSKMRLHVDQKARDGLAPITPLAKNEVVADGDFIGEHEENVMTDDESAASAVAAAARLADSNYCDDERWWKHVLQQDVEGVEHMLRAGYDRIDANKPFALVGTAKTHQQSTSLHHHNGGETSAAGLVSPLHTATRAGNVDMIKLLLGYGADPNVENSFGDTALLQAWLFWNPKHSSLRKSLRYNAARRHAMSNEEATVTILTLLLSHGARVNAHRIDGSTALHEAARKGPARAVIVLLCYGADHEKCDTRGDTPIAIARERVDRERHGAVLEGRKRPCDELDEMARLLANWGVIKNELRYDEFLQLWWNWMAQDDTSGRSLSKGPSAAHVLRKVQLDIAQRQLEHACKNDKCSEPYWTYDAVRQNVCCRRAVHRKQALRELEQALSKEHILIRHGSARRVAKSQEASPVESQARVSPHAQGGSRGMQARPASDTLLLSVPLDKYLLGEAQPGFFETRRTENASLSERQKVMAQIKEKDANKWRIMRDRIRRLKAEARSPRDSECEGLPSLASPLRQRRKAAALAIASDAELVGCRRAIASSLLHHQPVMATEPSRSTLGVGVAPVNQLSAEVADLETDERASGAHGRVTASIPSTQARALIDIRNKGGESHSTVSVHSKSAEIQRGKSTCSFERVNRLKHDPAQLPKFNETANLPPTSTPSEESKDKVGIRDGHRHATAMIDCAHCAFPWEYCAPGQQGCPPYDYFTSRRNHHPLLNN